MIFIHSLLFYTHIVAGSMALCLFWMPALMKKGSINHIRFGRYYANAMYTVIASGALMSLMVLVNPLAIKGHLLGEGQDPAVLAERLRLFWAFLLYLSLLTFVAVRQGVAVLTAKSDTALLRSPLHILPVWLLLFSGIALLATGIIREHILFIVFGIFGPILALQTLRYCYKKTVSPKAWLIEHFSSIIGSGIGAHTAFIAFGGRYLFEGLGQWQLLFWVAPGVIGAVCIAQLAKRYTVQKQPS